MGEQQNAFENDDLDPTIAKVADRFIELMDDSKGKLEKVRRKTKSTESPKETPDSPRYKALGNAVTVNVAEWIMKAIKTYEENQ